MDIQYRLHQQYHVYMIMDLNFFQFLAAGTDDNTEFIVDSMVVPLSFGVDITELALHLAVINVIYHVFVCRIECGVILNFA